MFQDLDIRYDNAWRKAAPEADSVALIRREDGILAALSDGRLAFPAFGQLSPAARGLEWRYAFTLGESEYFLTQWDDESPLPEGFEFVASREYRNLGPKDAVFAAAVSESLHRWYEANRFCSRCGKPMRDSDTERARVCPDCGLTVYPKICPAVIVAVTHGDRLLLTKYQGRAFKRYALVAGFAEIGESIEDTVRREVLEETGLRVKNLRYYKSQPWVFTDSLLFGFRCELEGSDKITIQQSELSEAGWYRRDEIPGDYSGISLTGEMIERFKNGTDDCG
jgi:NAD+ diphosphatase